MTDKNYKYLFGPVPSRRLGMSLGVDLVPRKVCSLNCVYCEAGHTTKLTTRRMDYVPARKITDELIHYFKNNPAPDFITFSGNGEPTLNAGIGEVISHIKKNHPAIPIAVLTNGTLLSDSRVRKELMMADLVLPSLDAATQKCFEKINVPADGLTVEKYIQGIADFRKEFKGLIWLEVFILPGYNDSEKELLQLKKAFQKIHPDCIQLNTLDRPGRISGLKAASTQELETIKNYWRLNNTEIIAAPTSRQHLYSYRNEMENAILSTIARRPCTADDLAKIMGTHVNEINKYMKTLEDKNKIEYVREERGIFYRVPED
ncbi:MAG TPA: radical SAM protein [Tangfeifania sp.]|nr:radical SAM protein [Tangfeifania sp.]